MTETMDDWNKKAWAELTVAERNAAFVRECERRAGATREEMLTTMTRHLYSGFPPMWLRRILTGAE